MALPTWFYNDPESVKEDRLKKKATKKKTKRSFPFKTIVIILLLANLGFGVYFWLWSDHQIKRKVDLISNQTIENQKELDSISRKVNGLPSASDIVSELDWSPYSPFNR